MNTLEILSAFPRLKALVIGDICLDRWCTYDPAASEPSCETGIPRLGVVSTEVTPGAGGTVMRLAKGAVTRKLDTATTIFCLKNHHGYADKVEVKSENINRNLDARQLAEATEADLKEMVRALADDSKGS